VGSVTYAPLVREGAYPHPRAEFFRSTNRRGWSASGSARWRAPISNAATRSARRRGQGEGDCRV